MMNLKLFSRKIALLLLLVGTLGYSQKKYVESFDVADDVEVSLNTTYTNIVFETWNKNKVEVEAYIDGEKLSEKEKQDLMKNWDLDISGNSKKVTINSNAGNQAFALGDMNLPNMDFMGPLMEDMVMPIIHNIKVPPLPNDILENLGNIQFDYEAYQKDDEGYMKKFEAQMDKKFGKDFEEKMEAWGKSFEKSFDEKKADSIGEAYGKRMEAWGEAFRKNMEAWGEEYGKKMEAWANEFENNNGNYTKTVTKSPHGTSVVIQGNRNSNVNSSNAKKTIIIRLPKNAKTEVNVRHGQLKMADAKNVKANLNYAPFTANSIDGGKTLITASYAPVKITTWKQGVLNVKYVDQCNIETTQNINLQANSSNVRIGNITNQAFLSGSFGDLEIVRISDGFETLDIRLENTDAEIKVPTGAFSFYFNGNRSTLKYPKSLQLKESKTSGKVLVKGFNQNNSSNKTLTINSNYSNVILQ